MPILYDIPPKLVTAVNTNQASLIGAIIKDNATGQIIGHVQQTSGIFNIIYPVISSSVNPIGIIPTFVEIYQNFKIQKQLKEVLHQLDKMQFGIQFGNLLTALNIGVTIVSTLIILKKLNDLESRFDKLESKLQEIINLRRADEFRYLVAEIEADCENIERISKWSDPQEAGVELFHSLSKSYHKVLTMFDRDKTEILSSDVKIGVINYFLIQIFLIRFIQESIIGILFSANQLRIVEDFGLKEVGRMTKLLSELHPNKLNHLVSVNNKDHKCYQKQYDKTNEISKLFVLEIMQSINSLYSQISISHFLMKQNISSIDYLEEVKYTNVDKIKIFPDPESTIWQELKQKAI